MFLWSEDLRYEIAVEVPVVLSPEATQSPFKWQPPQVNAKFEIIFLCNKGNDGVCITANRLSRLKFSPSQKFQAILKKNIHSDMLDYKRHRKLQKA